MPLVVMRLLVLLLLLPVALAAQPAWEPVSPLLEGPASTERVFWRTGATGALFGVSESGLLVRSRDGGQTTEAVLVPQGQLNLIWASETLVLAWDADDSLVAGRVLVSRDGGTTWTGGGPVEDAFLYDFDVVGDTLVAAANPATGSGAARVFWSVDGGTTWTPADVVDLGFDANLLACFTRSLYVAAGRLHAVTGCGLYRAKRGAEEWEAVYEGALTDAGVPLELWDSAVGGDVAYVTPSGFTGDFWTDIYRQIEDRSWVRLQVGSALGVSNLRLDSSTLAAYEQAVAVLTQEASLGPDPGFALSLDRGATWALHNDGLPALPDGSYVLGNLFEADGRLYLGAFDGTNSQQFVLDLSMAVAAEEPALPSDLSALRAWPNPVRDVLTLSTGADDTDRAVVRVFDLLGRTRLARTVFEQPVRLDVRALPPGVYVVEVRRAEAVQATRVTVAR